MVRISRADSVCVVWLADIQLAGPGHHALLNDVERARRDQYLRADDRTRFTLAAALLRLVAAEEAGLHPTDVLIDRTCERCGRPHGKPRLPGTGLTFRSRMLRVSSPWR